MKTLQRKDQNRKMKTLQLKDQRLASKFQSKQKRLVTLKIQRMRTHKLSLAHRTRWRELVLRRISTNKISWDSPPRSFWSSRQIFQRAPAMDRGPWQAVSWQRSTKKTDNRTELSPSAWMWPRMIRSAFSKAPNPRTENTRRWLTS